MPETIATILLAAALYLVLRRLPVTGEAATAERVRSRTLSRLERQEQVDRILSEVVPAQRSSIEGSETAHSSADAVSAERVFPVEVPPPPSYSPEVEALLVSADQLFEAGKLDEAELNYVKLCAIEPKIAHVYNRLGAIYLKRENLEDAKEALEAGLKFEPMNGQILNNLGLIYFKQSKFTDAVRYYERSIRVERGIPQRYLNLGLAFMALRQYSKAAHQFKRASNLEPENEEVKRLVVEAQTKYAESRVGIVSR